MKWIVSISGLLLSLFSLSAGAGWELDNQESAFYFASVKQSNIAEIHRFDTLSGSIDDQGKAVLELDLASVNTNIEVRNERMVQYLFEVANFPKAMITVDLSEKKRQQGLQHVTAILNLHGVEKSLEVLVRVTEVEDWLYVTTVAPILLNAESFGLDQGIEKLRELATLKSISTIVPVTFSLAYRKQESESKDSTQ